MVSRKQFQMLFGCAVIFTGVLSACGVSIQSVPDGSSSSSSSGGSAVTTAEGLWTGKITNPQERKVTEIILDDGTFYFFYSSSSDLEKIAGVMQGGSSSEKSLFSSSDAKEFPLEGLGVTPRSLSSSYANYPSQFGTVVGTSYKFSLTASSSYSQEAKLSDVVGSFSGEAGSISSVVYATNFSINQAGILSGTSQQCQFSGTVSPHKSVNVFDAVITFKGGTCVLGANSLKGIAYYDSSSKRLLMSVLNTARDDNFIFSGSKQ